jgi:hypothetical protein
LKRLAREGRSGVGAQRLGVPFPGVDDVVGRLAGSPTVDDADEGPVAADTAVSEGIYTVGDSCTVLGRANCTTGASFTWTCTSSAPGNRRMSYGGQS